MTQEEIDEAERLIVQYPVLGKYLLYFAQQEVGLQLVALAEGMEKRYTDPKLLAVAAALRKTAEIEA